MDEKKDGESNQVAMSSSAVDRAGLKKALASRDFFADGASSLLPNSFVPRHRTKPSRALEDALEYRRQHKKEREEALAAARRQTLSIELNNSPERIANAVKHAADERDEEVMVSKFMRGEHWIVNGADVERKQLDREETLHAQSAQIIANSSVMQQDYPEKRIGKVVLPVETPEEEAEHERQSDYIYKINSRIGLFDTYKSYLVEVMRLQDCCNSQEEEALFLIEEVEKGRKSNEFQWQLERNNRIKELRAKTAVDSEDLDHARMRMRSIRKEINFKFPEMSTALLFEEEKEVELDVPEDVNLDDAEAEAFRDAGMSVYGWIIGRLTHDGKICCILFGQFNRDVQPPSHDWVFVGKNVDRNLITTATLSDASISASQSALSEGGGVTSSADSDHVMTELDMLSAKGDIMTVTPVTLTDDSYKAATNQKPAETLTYYVSGSSIFSVNGRYMEHGVACNVPKYRNLRGWSVYRVALMEIPDLGILAENCYGALKGPPISVMLDRKSDRAFAELVDRTRDIKDGSVQFKRRFAEMSRSGQRIINSDQTSQLYRNQELRAEARSESDRMMMMILQAVSSAKSGEDHVVVVDKPKRPFMESIHELDDAEDGATHASESNHSVHTFKSKSSVKSSRSKMSRTKRGKSGAASVATSGTAATGPEMAMKGVLTGVDLDIKVTLSKGIHYQTGSQGFPLARRKGFLEEEAELSCMVTKCIEAREQEIFTLRIESEKVSKTYLESEGLLRDLDTDVIVSDLFRQMRKVREATILTAEALGAWARLCYNEKNKAQKATLYNADSVVDPKSMRTYCVIIAFKGPEIYPQSQEMKSQTGRWSRGLEKARVATNFRYIGEYKTMEEALESFSGSVSKLLPEQLLAEDAQGARAVVGLRSCGKHFLVRSNAVPNNTPCECCRAKLLAAPDLVAPSALQDDTENLQQFIWHGVDYLEKLWTDIDFLDENILLKRAFPHLDVKYNPLLLLSDDFSKVLGQVTVEDGEVLHYLKGRQEQVRDAAQSGTIISKTFTDRELMGLPYRTRSNTVVDLDKEAAILEVEKAHHDAFEKSIKSGGKDSSVNALRPPLPTSPLNGTGTTSILPSARGTGDEPLPFTPWSSLSPRAALESADIMGRIMPGAGDSPQVQFFNKAVSWLEEDHLDFVGKNRLVRSFHILAQSTTLTKHKLPQTVVPGKLKESVLKRNNILRSTSMPGLLGIATERPLDREGVLHNDDKTKTIETEVGYFYRGAFFAVPQMRAPPANRIDDVWCRSDVGEWHGLSKGRAMRSYEFQENVKLQGRLKNEERKRLQMMIKRHIENDIVYTDVSALKSLIVQSKEIRGSVLALDVIQAEQFLKYRVHLIITIRKMQAMARGTIGRRRVRKIKAALKSAAQRVKRVEIESISLSRQIVPRIILDGISSALAKLTATRFRITMNFSGMVTVLTIRKAVRSEKRGFYLCPACNRRDVVKVLDRINKCFRSETAACTCRWWQGEERWSVQIFDPLSRKEEVITLTMSQVREHIEFITLAKPLMNPKYRQRALVGKSFDRLQALFDASFVTFDGQLEHSNSLARRRAAEESCILPLVPRVVAEDVLEATRRRQDLNLAIDRILPFGFQYTEGPLTVTTIDHIEDSVAIKQWEPIADLEFALRHVTAVKHHIIVLETRVQNTRQIMIEADMVLLKHATRNTELDTMRYEDSRTTFLRLDEDIKIARDRIQRAMKYQKEGISSFQLEEANAKLDWKQSYDENEDGNAWEGLNNCRKLEKKWSGTLQHYHNCSAKIPLLVIEKTRLAKDAEKARENYEFAISEANRYAPTLGQADEVLLDVKQITRAAVKNSVAVLCMPRKRRWPNQRRVQRMPYRNVFIRDPFVRAQKENIGLWNLLERRVMALRPILKTFTGKAVLRCVVEIYQDPLTKFIMVRINQDENPVEESTQHIDMQVSKNELSEMTNSALDTDILLRPADVQVILSKAPNWPAVHIKKEVHVFKTIDCFVRHQLISAEEISVTEPVKEGQRVTDEVAAAPPELHEVNEWIPPSKRPRSLDGVKVHPTKGHPVETLVSYATLRAKKELSQVETARALMTYLRLHPYTGRPCLGLVHFVRRQIYCVKSITRCRWFFDLAKGMPSTWANELVDELRLVGGRLWKITTRGSLDSLEVRLNAHTRRLGLTLVIPFRDILENLARNQPILLASLLCETITNRYSAELHNNLLDYVDMQLPGEEPRRFWRQSLFGEMPRLEFQQSKSSKYRGPIYKTHRFFSGRYLEAVFSISANFDLRIQLGRPTDGNFWGHVYSGDTIVVDISRDELRAYIAKASTHGSLVSSLYLGNLKLLHPNHWLELFPLLLDVVILPPSAVSGSAPLTPRPADAQLYGDDDEMVQISEESQITERLCRKVQYVMDKFNAWASRTKGQCDPLEPELMQSVISNIEAINNRLPWTLELQKDDASRKLVEVRCEVWKSRDLRRFNGKYDCSFEESRESLLSYTGSNSSRHFKPNASISVGTSGVGDNSFWSVRILTDEFKSKYFVDVLPTKDTDAGVEILLAEEESALMAIEEGISRRARLLEKQISRRFEIAEEIARVQRKVRVELMPAATAAEKLVADTKRRLKEIGSLYLDYLDAWFSSRAGLVYNNATRSLGIKGGGKKATKAKAKRLLFLPGSFSAEPKATVVEVAAVASASVVAPKSRKQSLLEAGTGKQTFVPAAAKQPTLPKNIQITLKKFDKVIGAFQADMATRSDVDVRLLSSIRHKGYTSKRSARGQTTFLDNVEYSSAWYPRYDVAIQSEASNNFRHTDQWCHYAFTSKPSRTETRVLNLKGTLLLISDPVVGPFDIVAFNLYDATNSQSWSVIFAAGGDLPRFGHAPKPQKTSASHEEGAVVLVGDKLDLAPLYRLCAERLVWNAITKATINAIIAANMEELDQGQGAIEDDIADNLDYLESLKEQLTGFLSETTADGFDHQIAGAPPSEALNDYAGPVDLTVETVEAVVSVQLKGRQGSAPGAIPEIIHHSVVQYFRDSGFGIRVFGMMVPADEALGGIPLVVFSQDWLRLCRHYLGDQILNRRFTTSAFIWSRESDVGLPTLNPRANRWIEDYEKNYGWRKGKDAIRRMKKQMRVEAKLHGGNHAPYTSDVVILLRYGERELPLLTAWLKDRYDEYAPMRELRRQKEGREREFRISNHKIFCNYVYGVAASFLDGIEAMYKARGSINTDQTDKYNHKSAAISYYCRVLLSRFLSLRTDSDKKFADFSLDAKSEAGGILDEAFLIDTDVVHPSEETLLRFDALPAESCLTDRDGILQWDPTAFVLDPLDSPMLQRPDLQPRVGQVVYAIYKLHCFACKCPANTCKFPGCRCIRLESAAIVQSSQSVPDLTEIGQLLPELKGTGSHPIERSIRRYLLQGRDLYNHLLPVTLERPLAVSPAEEIQLEESTDQAEAKRLEMIEYLRISWQALQIEGHEFRYVSRRVLRPELSSVLCAQDVLEARGGIKIAQDEEPIANNKDGLAAFIPRPLQTATLTTVPADGGGVSSSSVTATTASATLEDLAGVSVTGGLIQVPNSLMLALLGGCGVDGHGRVVPLWAIDPYPAENSENNPKTKVTASLGRQEIQRPMAKPMYDWLVDHLCLSRPSLLPSPASGDRGQLLPTAASLKLDRQHCEGTCFLVDGSLVLVQLLHGVLVSATLCSDDLSGAPSGAIRYCPSSLFEDLHRGLTVVAYDVRAGVTRATALEGRALSRVAEAFEVADDNIPLIACKIREHASMVIRLSRVGEVCTAVAVDVNGISRQTAFTVKDTSINARVKALGRRAGVFDARQERLRAAKQLALLKTS